SDVFAATWGDYNNDGFMDVFLNGHSDKPLMENSGTQNNFLIIKLVGNGEKTNISAIGTRVEVSSSKGIQVREVSGGRGCCEQDMLPLHFGVGNENVVEIQVQWTDGEICTFSNVNVEGGPLFQISESNCTISEF
ncbi:MAG TPA: ASPIC/UnbV domain-containing protein, partial [Thermodesulfobacteriota bacterium]|nr:ASPIC/UnbV domain-containing protein [Thermodesulfobacteriota bacterium]